MASVVSVIRDTVPISQFNRGLAGKIFDDVKTSGAKVVMKNNTAECVLLSPDEYVRLMDELNDARLFALAVQRTSNYDPSKLISEAEMDSKLNITQEDLDSMVQRDRNHPSIILWSIGNEVPEQSVEGGESVARMLLERVKALDPTRPVTQACDQVKAEPRPATEAFLKTLDIVGVNYADRWRERTETFFDEEKLEHPEWVLMGTEDVSVGGVRGDVRLRTETSVWGRTPYFANMLKAEKLWKYIRVHPFVMGSFMWTGVDYLGECFWPDKHASCGVLDTCGFRKDGFYFYQSQWRPDLTVLHPVPSHLNLPYAPGEIFPLVVYTNCFTVEAFVDGRSYGVKAYEFPAQGMTKQWAHFERPLSPITTSDLHLTWDVPYPRESIVLVGRDRDGRVIREETLRRAGKPERLDVHSTVGQERDGSEICQIEIRLLDREGLVVPDDDREVCVTVEGGELLGMDNGRPDDHTPYGKPARETFRGLALCVVRAEGTKLRVRFECQGLPEACYAWEKVRRVHCAPAWNERNGEDVICAP